jgi:hypothetical protein
LGDGQQACRESLRATTLTDLVRTDDELRQSPPCRTRVEVEVDVELIAGEWPPVT